MEQSFMKLFPGGKQLDRKLTSLAKEHENISLAVAWASTGTDFYSVLKHCAGKLDKVVIGTHFYQTHPDVLTDFHTNNSCRFVMQPKGVFHPKVFLFWSESSWDVLIGSANLTRGALSKNTELVTHISSADADDTFRSEVELAIAEYWDNGELVSVEDVDAYASFWKIQQQYVQRLSGTYGSSKKSNSPMHTQIMKMPWKKFFKKVKQDQHHGFAERCELLSLVRQQFETHNSFADMDIGVRKTIAGLPNEWNNTWGWFGSMRGAGYFHQAINDNNQHIANALDLVPMDGVVSKSVFDEYVNEFLKAFPNGRHGIGIASRLLALKRPDQFVCLDSRNKVQLCRSFGIKQSDMSYQRYWDDIVCRIIDSVWWQETLPLDSLEQDVWFGRAAMLDAIFYEP